MSKRSLALLLVVSLIVAIGGLVQHLFFPWSVSDTERFIRRVAPAVVWLILFVAGLVAYGRPGLWLLIGVPFVLARPLGYAGFFLICGTEFFPMTDCP
jgi:hypothetical protein